MQRLSAIVTICLLFLGSALAQTRAIPNRQAYSTDQRLTREVMHELLMLPYYSVFDDLSFRVDGSSVTLMGAVVNATTKSDARNSVKRIEGVTQVNDQIEVLPVSPMDDRIRRAEYRTLFSDPVLSKYAWGAIPSIHIIVKNGHVTLTGFVDNTGDKNLAKIRANTVPDVFSVTDNLQVRKS